MNLKQLYLLFFIILTVQCNSQSQGSKKPNIIIILTDDQGYGDVGFNGSNQLKTPNLDKLAKNGVVFTNGYSSYAVCGPSRAGIMTGRYQDRFGFSRNPLFAPNDVNQGLPLSEETLAEALKKGGYKNIAIGKWHLGTHKALRPLQRGFDEFFGFLSGGHQYFPEMLTVNNLSEVVSQFDAYNTKLLKNDNRIEEKEYLTDAFSREAVNFIENNHEKPFFMYLAYNAPHAPLQAPDKYLERFKHIKNKDRRTYAAMVSAVDDGVGNILKTLTKLKIEENTIVFFLSDNGGNEAKGSYNGLLKKGKGSLFEGGIRVPFAMQWKGTVEGNQIYDNPIISLDIFATAIKNAGISSKNNLDGVDLIPFLTNKNDGKPHKELYWRMYDKQAHAVRRGDLKYIQDNKEGQLVYNLKKDISEKNPLSDVEKEKELKKLFSIWNDKNKKPVFDGLPQDKEYSRKNPDRFKDVEKY